MNTENHNNYKELLKYIKTDLALKIISYLYRNGGQCSLTTLCQALKIDKSIIQKIVLNDPFIRVSFRKDLVFLENFNLITTLNYLKSNLESAVGRKLSFSEFLELLLNNFAKDENKLLKFFEKV